MFIRLLQISFSVLLKIDDQLLSYEQLILGYHWSVVEQPLNSDEKVWLGRLILNHHIWSGVFHSVIVTRIQLYTLNQWNSMQSLFLDRFLPIRWCCHHASRIDSLNSPLNWRTTLLYSHSNEQMWPGFYWPGFAAVKYL